MKNFGSIILLLAAAATQVASLPTAEVAHYQQIRAASDIAHEIYARVPKKNKDKDAGKNKTP